MVSQLEEEGRLFPVPRDYRIMSVEAEKQLDTSIGAQRVIKKHQRLEKEANWKLGKLLTEIYHHYGREGVEQFVAEHKGISQPTAFQLMYWVEMREG